MNRLSFLTTQCIVFHCILPYTNLRALTKYIQMCSTVTGTLTGDPSFADNIFILYMTSVEQIAVEFN